MSNLNDLQYAGYGGPPGALPQLEAEWMEVRGLTGNQSQIDFLDAEGIGPGSLNDRWIEYWGGGGDVVPPDTPGNLLLDYNNLNTVNWDAPDQTLTYLGEGWWRIRCDSPDSTRSLVQFYLDPAPLGKTYRIQAEFRNKGAIGTDYRLAIAEYEGTAWRGATTTDLDTLVAGDPTPVLKTADRLISDATSDRIRFAVQFVNPPSAGMQIDMRLPAMLLQGGQINMPDLTLGVGSGGARHGYRRGNFGTANPNLLNDGNEIRDLYLNNNNGRVVFKVEGTYPQDEFTSMEVVGYGTLNTADADLFDDSGGETFWRWNNTGWSWTDGDTLAVDFV